MSDNHAAETSTPTASDAVDLDADADRRAMLAVAADKASASAASVLAQMVRAPVPTLPLGCRVLSGSELVELPQVNGDFPVLAHRSVIGDFTGDVLLAQSSAMASWSRERLPGLGSGDAVWGAQRLSDIAGIALAAFAMSLGRSIDIRIEPEAVPPSAGRNSAAVLADAGDGLLGAVAFECQTREAVSIGDFFVIGNPAALEELLAAAAIDR